MRDLRVAVWAAVGLLFALPHALAAARGEADIRGFAAAGLVASFALVAGGWLIEGALDRLGLNRVAPWAALVTVLGTGAGWYATDEPMGGQALAFLAGAAGAGALVTHRARLGSAWAPGLALGAGLALLSRVLEIAAGTLTGAPGPFVPRAGGPFLMESLFSSRHGFFFWTPVAWVGLFGLSLLSMREARLARAAALAIVIVALASAFAAPWWWGRLGNGRWMAALPLLALGLAPALEALRQASLRTPRAVLAGGGALLVAWNLVFMQQYRAELIPRDDTVSFAQVAENNATLVARAVGSPVAWPANWVFARAHGVGPERFDLAVGRFLFSLPGDLRGTIDVGDLETDRALLAEGWSVRHSCGEAVCREVEGRARLFVPLDRPQAFDLAVRAQGRGALVLLVNGRPTAQWRLDEALADHAARVPSQRFGRGLNEIALAVPEGGRALVDRLVFVPVREQP